jgi:hypothetical protein
MLTPGMLASSGNSLVVGLVGLHPRLAGNAVHSDGSQHLVTVRTRVGQGAQPQGSQGTRHKGIRAQCAHTNHSGWPGADLKGRAA